MKLLLICLAGILGFSRGGFTPISITYDALLNGGADDALKEGLTGDGLIQLRGIPLYAELRSGVLRAARKCGDNSPDAKRVTLGDGTVRTTFATQPGSELDPVGSGECARFAEISTQFRTIVAQATAAFAEGVDAAFELGGEALLGKLGGLGQYNSMSEVAARAEHLEHFHQYAASASTTSVSPTIDLHTDQGLFIAFTPAFMVGDDGFVSEDAGGFFVQRSDGTIAKAELAPDALVFMLGDGVNHLDHAKELRSAPHSMQMPKRTVAGVSRAWYGRMVLPPRDAVHSQLGTSFGELRDETAAAFGNVHDTEETVALGCSQNLHARRLQYARGNPSACGPDDNTIYCWFRCMPYGNETTTNNPFGASPEVCATQGQEFNCLDLYGSVYAPDDGLRIRHGSFYPGCHGEGAPQRLYYEQPTVPSQSASGCGDLAAFSRAHEFTGSLELQPNTTLYWRIDGTGEDAEVAMRMVHNGPASWLSVGLPLPGGDHGGMNGGDVVMGIAGQGGAEGASYTGVHVFHIDEVQSAIRFWHASATTEGISDAESEFQPDCFSAFSFRARALNSKAFDLTAEQTLIWGINDKFFVDLQDSGNHGGRGTGLNHGHVVLNFGETTADTPTSATPPPANGGGHGHVDHDHGDDATDDGQSDATPSPAHGGGHGHGHNDHGHGDEDTSGDQSDATNGSHGSVSDTEDDIGSKPNAAIVGGVLGGLAVLALVSAMIFKANKSKATKRAGASELSQTIVVDKTAEEVSGLTSV